MMVNQTLAFQRQFAAEASNGISSEPIYRTFEQIVIQLQLKGYLLDFGAGTGNLVSRMNNLGYFSSLTAIDLLPRPQEINHQIEWIVGDLNEKIALPEQSFDVIISAEVIEHLENPRAIAREWFRLLKPGGTLILSTPNNESYRSFLALLIKGHFVAFGDTCYPAHITALLRKDIERILQENNFDSPKFLFTNFGRIPKLTQISWQKISGGLLKGLRFSDNLLAVVNKPN